MQNKLNFQKIHLYAVVLFEGIKGSVNNKVLKLIEKKLNFKYSNPPRGPYFDYMHKDPLELTSDLSSFFDFFCCYHPIIIIQVRMQFLHLRIQAW